MEKCPTCATKDKGYALSNLTCDKEIQPTYTLFSGKSTQRSSYQIMNLMHYLPFLCGKFPFLVYIHIIWFLVDSSCSILIILYNFIKLVIKHSKIPIWLTFSAVLPHYRTSFLFLTDFIVKKLKKWDLYQLLISYRIHQYFTDRSYL